jgi:hypothetical protein
VGQLECAENRSGQTPAGGRADARKASKHPPAWRAPLQKRIAELKSRIPAGGLREAVIRALLICGASKGRRIPATNCETLARFLPQTAKPESLRRSTPETGVR